jgi:hypothetical protein
MTIVILDPKKVLIAALISAVLICGSILGVLAFAGVFHSQIAQAYGAAGVGAKEWYFAEGYTGTGFEEWILIYNPSADVGGSGETIRPTIYMFGNGGYVGRWDVPALVPGQRISININQATAYYGYSGDVSINVSSGVSGAPFICERAMYYNYKGQITGGSQVFGYQEGPNE